MIPQQRRNETPPAEPRRVSVGSRQHGGELSATQGTNERGRRVFVNACQISSQLIDVSIADAREFAWQLLALTTPDDVRG